MKLIFFAEGGGTIGLGHLRRSSVLAQEFLNQGDELEFMLRDESAKEWLKKKKPKLHIRDLGKADCDVLVIDSYLLSDEEIKEMFPAKLIVGFEDFDESREIFEIKIAPWRGNNPKLQIIDPEFRQFVRDENNEKINKILITLGGFGTCENINKIAHVVREHYPNAEIAATVREDIDCEGITLLRDPDSMGRLYSECDIAISSGGQTIFELAATGTPSIVTSHTENQQTNISFIQNLGILNYVKDEEELRNVLRELESKSLRDEQTKLSKHAFDFDGAKRLIKLIKENV